MARAAVRRVEAENGDCCLARSFLSSASAQPSVNEPLIATIRDNLGGAAVGEFGALGDVGRAAELVLVARQPQAIGSRNLIRLDMIGAELDGQRIGGQGVLGPAAGCAAMADHDRIALARVGHAIGGPTANQRHDA